MIRKAPFQLLPGFLGKFGYSSGRRLCARKAFNRRKPSQLRVERVHRFYRKDFTEADLKVPRT